MYVILVFIPLFLRVDNLFVVFTNLDSLIAFLALPLVLIMSYLIHLFLVGLISRIFWRYTEKISPSKDGVIPRNIPSKTANLYHIRSFRGFPIGSSTS
jgi:hypothetical protein